MAERAGVAVTGMGAVSALGPDCRALLRAIEAGHGGIRRIRRFDTNGFSVHTAAEVDVDSGALSSWATSGEEGLCVSLAVSAAREALADAGLDPLPVPPHRIGLVFGTNFGEPAVPVHRLGEELARELGLEGPTMTVCTACSSSTGAIGLGRDLVVSGRADMVLAGGADVLTPRVFAGFHSLGVLTPGRCAPFSTPFGTSLGEGAGFLVLENADVARGRGVEARAFVSGYGLSGDGYHETSPDPRGRGVTRAVRSALLDAGITAADVGYVNAHGSGTEANDRSEWQGIRRGLDGRETIPVSSSKGALGHAQGAAGVLETIVTILAMRHGLMPPTLNFGVPRPYAPLDPIGGARPRPGRYDHAVCLNAAFGGANAAIVVSRSARTERSRRRGRSVSVVGVGLVSGEGLGVEAWERGGEPCARGPVPPFSLSQVDPRIDPQGLDPSSLYLTAAAAMALSIAGDSLRAGSKADAGLVLGAVKPSPQSVEAYGRSISDRGLARVSASAFARIVLNAPAGFCTKLLGLRGPLMALTVGAGSGLAAIVLALELLGRREDVTFMLGAAVDEPDSEEMGDGSAGAACVALASTRDAPDSSPRVTAWEVGGGGRISETVDRMLSASGERGPPPDGIFDERDYTGGGPREWALPSSLAFVAALSALKRGDVRRALVTSDTGKSVSLAVLLEA